jgi:hypothetical protein
MGNLPICASYYLLLWVHAKLKTLAFVIGPSPKNALEIFVCFQDKVSKRWSFPRCN